MVCGSGMDSGGLELSSIRGSYYNNNEFSCPIQKGEFWRRACAFSWMTISLSRKTLCHEFTDELFGSVDY
jgi:hypothetical protein